MGTFSPSNGDGRLSASVASGRGLIGGSVQPRQVAICTCDSQSELAEVQQDARSPNGVLRLTLPHGAGLTVMECCRDLVVIVFEMLRDELESVRKRKERQAG